MTMLGKACAACKRLPSFKGGNFLFG